MVKRPLPLGLDVYGYQNSPIVIYFSLEKVQVTDYFIILTCSIYHQLKKTIYYEKTFFCGDHHRHGVYSL